MADNIKKTVGRSIQVLREKRGWSQEKLAEMADLDRTYVGPLNCALLYAVVLRNVVLGAEELDVLDD